MFPLRRRVMPRGWHNEEWSRQWLQVDGSTAAIMASFTPTSTAQRIRQRSRSQLAPTQRVSSSGADSSHDTDQSCGIRVRSCSEVGQVGGSLFGRWIRSLPRPSILKSVIDKTRGTCGSWSWPGRPSVWRLPSKQWSPQLRSRIVFKKSTTSVAQDWRS